MNTKTPNPLTEQYAIARLKKIKRQGLMLTHAARAENGVRPEHAIPGAPPPEELFNAAPLGVDFPTFVMGRYERAIGEGRVYRPRRDQVLAIEGVLTASPEFFRPDDPGRAGYYTSQSVSALRDRGLHFLRDRYTNKLIRVELQLDEVTPHIQFAYFPIDERGNWSAKNCTTRRILSGLWTDWAAAMKGLGLRRAIAGSQAKHEPIKRYYAAIHKFGADSVRAAQKLVIQPLELPAPSRHHLLDPKGYIAGVNAELATWAKRETKRVLKLVEPLLAAASDAALTRRRAKQLRLTIEGQAGKIVNLETGLQKREQQFARLEPVSVAAVAEKIGYGEHLDLAPYRNALTFLEHFEGLNYDQSIGWLSAEFGPEAAAATAADLMRTSALAEITTHNRPRILTIDEIREGLRAQLLALDADSFRIRVKKRGTTPAKTMAPFTSLAKSENWTFDEVMAGVSRLKELAAGNDIGVVPVSNRHSYLCVTQMNAPTALTEVGLYPCNVIRVGAEHYEAVLRVPEPLPSDENKAASKKLKALNGAKPRDVTPEAPLRLVGLRSEDVRSIRTAELVGANAVDWLGRHARPANVPRHRMR